MAASKVMHEGWLVRCGRRKIGRSYIHMRYFVLESRLLAYYKRKPVQDAVLPQNFFPFLSIIKVESGIFGLGKGGIRIRIENCGWNRADCFYLFKHLCEIICADGRLGFDSVCFCLLIRFRSRRF